MKRYLIILAVIAVALAPVVFAQMSNNDGDNTTMKGAVENSPAQSTPTQNTNLPQGTYANPNSQTPYPPAGPPNGSNNSYPSNGYNAPAGNNGNTGSGGTGSMGNGTGTGNPMGAGR